MAFSLRKPDKKAANTEEPQRGLSSFFRRKPQQSDLPTCNIDAGLSRALKTPNVDKKSREIQINNESAGRQALMAIEAVLYALDRVREIIDQCVEIVDSANSTQEPGARALLAESYDELRLSINTIRDETDENGALLIGAEAESLDIEMTGRARYSVASFRIDCSSKGLNLSPPADAFIENEEIESTLNKLKKIQDRLDRASAAYCRDANFLMSRLNEMPKQSLST